MIKLKEEYMKSDKICPICNKEVYMKDIVENNFIYSLTKKRKRIFAHKKLFIRKEKIVMVNVNIPFTKDDEYYTPKYVVDFFFPNGIDYDPATCECKAKEFGVEHYDTIETDGLKQDWTPYKYIWINPPFTDKYKFLVKAVETYNIAHNTIFILFPIDFLTTVKFHKLKCKCKLFIPKGRINFESGSGKLGKSPASGSVIIKLDEVNSVEYIDLKKGEKQ